MIQKHTHKLRRHIYKTGATIFFCCLPDCHFKIDAALAIGKKTLCFLCGSEFILDEYTYKLMKPSCNNCRKMKIKGPDGKGHFVRKSNIPIIASIAEDETENLKARLENATGKGEEDIL